jgi:hypothetical protein
VSGITVGGYHATWRELLVDALLALVVLAAFIALSALAVAVAPDVAS